MIETAPRREERKRRRRTIPWSLAVGVALVGLLVLVALGSFLYLPYDPQEMRVAERFASPGADHWLGTDQYGRDLFSRLAVGARTALLVGGVSVGIGLSVGFAVGALAGWRGGWLDELTMRLMDALAAFPGLLMAIVTASLLGAGTVSGALAIGLSSVPVFARLTRASFLSIRERAFVEAARAAGAGVWHLIAYHFVPNARSVLMVQATLTFAAALLADAALGYLGLGTQPPYPSWGRMLREAQSFVDFSVYPVLLPGLAIAWGVLGFNLLGDGLRDWLDPQVRRGGGGFDRRAGSKR